MQSTEVHATTLQPAPSWHALDVPAAATALGTGPEGLSSGQASDRLSRFGPNSIASEHVASALELILNQFRSPLILLLLAAAAVMLAIGEAVDTVVILLVVVLNAAIGFFQERQAAKSVQA